VRPEVVLFVLILTFCKPEVKQDRAPRRGVSEKRLKEQFMRANQQLLRKENDELEAYARAHRFPVVTTASGIKLYVYHHSEKGDSIRAGSQVVMSYTVSLPDGTVCYSSDAEGKRRFEVEHEDIESGIHRGLQYLKRGDKAILLIPSYLAHGLMGDMKKIPPQSPVIYNLQVD
jgi:FKBP-type peptidyl-prolyl cis-trans isomerase FkpA